MSERSPWGNIQQIEEIADGISWVDTASHGGIKLSAKRNREMPKILRLKGGWYEEDVEYVRVYLGFPQLFPDKQEKAKNTLKNWHPDVYEQFYGEIIPEGQSFQKDEKLFLERHKNDYIALAAFGDWHEKVPQGFVGVFAGKGGRLPNGMYPLDTKWFLVPKQEYHANNFVINLEKHREIASLDKAA